MTRGAQNLYWKLCQNVSKELGVTRDSVHLLFKTALNAGKTTLGMEPSAFNIYFDTCLEASLRVWGKITMSPFDEDLKEFDHGFEPVNPR